MFQTVRQFQGRSSSGPSTTSRLLRDNLRVAGGVAGSAGGKSRGLSMSSASSSANRKNNNNNNSNNDVEQPSCWALTREHVRRELWSYLGLAGLFSIYLGILVCVFALKGVFPHRGVLTFCGVMLNGFGGINLLVSWLCYRCQRKRHRRSCGLSLCCACCACCGGEDRDAPPPSPPMPPKTRPRGQSLAFLTPEFAKYAEFSARDRRYDTKRHHFFKAYDPTRISISFAHKYWLEQQKPLLESGFGNPTLFPPSASYSPFPASPRNLRPPRSSEPKRRLLDTDPKVPRRQRST